jgi:hypothetical protein
MADYHFGIEIEVIVGPHKVRTPLSSKHALYYGKLAASLRKRGLKAKADDLQQGYTKRPEHYDKWWITKDGSLGSHIDKSKKTYPFSSEFMLTKFSTNGGCVPGPQPKGKLGK